MNNIATSIGKLTRLFIILFLGLSAGLVYWQVVAAQQVTSNVHNSRQCLASNTPVRGRIFDRNGVLLADSKPSNGCGILRHYYEPSLAGLIGYYAAGYQATGIEAQYDDYLSGRVGMTALDNSINKTLHRPPVGNDIYLTIDVRIQRIANQHFDDPLPVDNGLTVASNRGSVVITDPRTGEILAMVSRPSYDPNKLVDGLVEGNLSYYNQLAADKSQPLLMRPIQARYIPGSTYKTLTLLAGLDTGKTTLDQPFDRQQALGPIVINGQRIGPEGNNLGNTFRFPVSTEYGYTHSDNVIFAQIGVNTGLEDWMKYNKRFYVGEKIPFDLPVVPSTVFPAGKDTLADNELAANAFGQGFTFMTPLQMSLFDDAIANDGQLMRPRLVGKITDHDGNALETFSAQTLGAEPQMKQETAMQVRQAMFGVVRCGSGSFVTQLFNSNVAIIGKTGTAQVGGNQEPHGWMITQAPYSVNNPTELPKLTIVAMKENAGEGGFVVGPMIAHMYEDIFANVIKTPLPAPSSPGYCCSTKLVQQGCPA